MSSGDKFKARGVERDLKVAKQKLAQGKAGNAAGGLQRAKREIDGLALKYGEDHPEVQRLRALYDEASPEIMSAEKERKVREAFAEARPQDKILAVRFDQAQWVRGEAKTTDSEMVSGNARLITKTYTAEETLRVSVVVRSSDRLATIYYMYPRRDLHSGGQSMGGPYFGREMLLANFK